MMMYNNVRPLIWVFPVLLCFLLSCSPGERKSSDNVSQEAAKWETGVALYSFNRFSFIDALEKADSAGVKYVEGFFFHNLGKEFNDATMGTASEGDLEKMGQLMDEKGITMKSMYVGGANSREEWKRFFEMGKELGTEFLVCEPERDHWDMVDELAGQYSIKIAIHQHSKEAGSIYWHPDSVLSAIKDHPNFGACGDLGHWARSGLDPVESLRKLKGHLLGIHLKDIDSFDHQANDVVVGSGVVDFEGVVEELKSQDYKGMVYVECEHKMDDNLDDVKAAIDYFNGISVNNKEQE